MNTEHKHNLNYVDVIVELTMNHNNNHWLW